MAIAFLMNARGSFEDLRGDVWRGQRGSNHFAVAFSRVDALDSGPLLAFDLKFLTSIGGLNIFFSRWEVLNPGFLGTDVAEREKANPYAFDLFKTKQEAKTYHDNR